MSERATYCHVSLRDDGLKVSSGPGIDEELLVELVGLLLDQRPERVNSSTLNTVLCCVSLEHTNILLLLS